MADSVQGTLNIWPHYSKLNVQRAEATQGQTLGKDDFLKILVTQLRHQDPMQPMQDREFIAQMAQFSSFEQMMNMSAEISSLRQSLGISPNLIGKSIRWSEWSSDGTKLEEHTGVVDAIAFKNGMQHALVGTKEVTLDQILKVWQAGESSE